LHHAIGYLPPYKRKSALHPGGTARASQTHQAGTNQPHPGAWGDPWGLI
jgi:hypothetical protein